MSQLDSDREPAAESEWVSQIMVSDRPGALSALASVFSARGVNLTHLATGVGDVSHARLTFGFVATSRQASQLTRIIERLPMVMQATTLAFDDDQLRAAGVARFAEHTAFRPPPEARVRWSGHADAGEPVLFEGPYCDVVTVVAAARDAGALFSGLVVATT